LYRYLAARTAGASAASPALAGCDGSYSGHDSAHDALMATWAKSLLYGAESQFRDRSRHSSSVHALKHRTVAANAARLAWEGVRRGGREEGRRGGGSQSFSLFFLLNSPASSEGT
jgi:hypothetical protein